MEDTVPVELPGSYEFGDGLGRTEGTLGLLAVVTLGEDAEAKGLKAGEVGIHDGGGVTGVTRRFNKLIKL